MTDTLADQPELAGTLELVWRQARASLPAPRVDEWVAACRAISSKLGADAAMTYIRNSPAVAAACGADAALTLAVAVPEIAAIAGRHVATSLVVAAASIAPTALLSDHAFRSLWRSPKSITWETLWLFGSGAVAIAFGAMIVIAAYTAPKLRTERGALRHDGCRLSLIG